MQKIDKKIASVDHKIEIISSLKIDLISQIFLCNFNGIKSVIRIDFDIPNWLKKQRASEFQILNFLKTKIQNQKILYHDFCLLYTSPSPRDMRRSRMPSSA